MSEIDWNVELRRIEREYDGLPPEPTPARVRAERAAELRRRERSATRKALFGAWARVTIVVALAAALYWWPYGRACGVQLASFLAAESMVIVGALSIVGATWRHRLPLTHGVAMVLLIAGLALVTAELLPRFGAGTVAWVEADGWRCAAGALPGTP